MSELELFFKKEIYKRKTYKGSLSDYELTIRCIKTSYSTLEEAYNDVIGNPDKDIAFLDIYGDDSITIYYFTDKAYITKPTFSNYLEVIKNMIIINNDLGLKGDTLYKIVNQTTIHEVIPIINTIVSMEYSQDSLRIGYKSII